MHYDVIIVGAGPGGLSCANTLAGSGLKILVLEKSPGLGKKVCSGEISSKVLKGVEFKGCQEWKTVTVGTSSGTASISYERPFLKTVGRYELESYLKSKCDANTEFRFSEPVTNITNEWVETQKGKYYYRCLVGADGSFSRVREFLGLKMSSVVGWAFHYLVDAPAEEFRVYWLPKIFPRGYGYLMSKSCNQTMIGGAMACEPKDLGSARSLHNYLALKVKEWVQDEFLLDTDSMKSEAMRGNADYQGWQFRGFDKTSNVDSKVFLVGDAAGFLNPVTTEGIYYAIKSGEGIGKVIHGGKHKKEGYEIMKKLESTHRSQLFLFKLFTNPHLPFCRFVEWVLSDPRSGLRRFIFDFVFWKFMDE